MGLIKFLALRAVEAATIAVLILIMPYVPPNAEYSKSYTVTKSLPLEGKLALNERLKGVEKWHEGLLGPEAFAEYNGELYTSILGGDIIKITGDHITPIVKFGKPCKGLYEERICGRPLGLTFDKNGFLYAVDAYYGIFKVDIKTGKKVHLVSMDKEINGKKPKVANSLALASNGDIYWSDSSTEFSLEDMVFDILADGSGRLIHYNAKTQQNTVLIDGLHFANGVMLSEDEEYILVAETGNSRIYRYYLKGPKSGTHDVFLDGLPGLPDNINSDGQGGYLFPLIIARDSSFPVIPQILSPFPLLRKFVSRLFGLAELGFRMIEDIYPNELSQKAIHYIGHFDSTPAIITSKRTTIIRVSKFGEILESLHATDGRIRSISEAFIYKNYLLLGSPFNNYIGRITLEKAGLSHLKKATEKRAKREEPSTTTPKPTTTPSTTTPKPTTTKSTTTTSPPPPTTTTTTTTTKPPPTTTKPSTTTTRPPTTTKPPTTTSTTPKPPTTASTTIKPPTTTTTQAPSTTSTTTPAPSTTSTTTAKPSTTKPPTTTSTPPPTTTTIKPPTAASTSPPKTTAPSTPKVTNSPTTTTQKPSVTKPESTSKSSSSEKQSATTPNSPEDKVQKAPTNK